MSDTVGYTFAADNYCDECIGDVVGASEQFDGWALGAGISMSAEDNLDELAAAFGIDRSDEHTFDSGEFPKRIFAWQTHNECDEDAGCQDKCGACGAQIGECWI